MDKQTFISSFIPGAKEVSIVTINLDTTDFTFGDILRNVNKSYPLNGRERNKIISGEKAIALILKSKFLEPLSGVVFIICGEAIDINVVSCNYVVISVSEASIRCHDDIILTTDSIGACFRNNYLDDIFHFEEFYKRYVYDTDIEELYIL